MHPTQARRRENQRRSVPAAVEAPPSKETRLVEALEEYYATLDRGQVLKRQDFLVRFPDIAQELAVCLDNIELLEHIASLMNQQDSAGESDASMKGRHTMTLGDYRIIRQVGKGGMGVVYEAEQVSLGRRVALKVLPFAALMDARQLARFKNEALAAASLQHTNIVPVYSVGCERGVHFYAMQYVEGKTLAEVIGSLRAEAPQRSTEATGDGRQPLIPQAPAPTREAQISTQTLAALTTAWSANKRGYFHSVARLGIQAAEAVDHAHKHGVLHRDVKPGNLLLDTTGNLWVTDFGLARLPGNPGLTMTGEIMGTLRYMSPEQAARKPVPVDHRTDIYSLGAALYELLTLRPPFGGEDRAQLLQRIASEEPPPPRRLDCSIPAELETIVLKAMAKEPDARYATAGDLADDLRRFLEHRPILAKRPSLVERAAKWCRRHFTIVVSAFAVLWIAVAALAVSMVLVARQRNEAEIQRRRAEVGFRQARQAVDRYFTLVSETTLLDEPGLQPLREKLLQEAIRYYGAFAQQRGDDPQIQVELAATHLRLAQIYYQLNRINDSILALRKAFDLVERIAQEHTEDPRMLLPLAGFWHGERSLPGSSYQPIADNAQAHQVLQRGAALWESFVTEHPEVRGFREDLSKFYDLLEDQQRTLGLRPEAFRSLERVRELREQLVQADPDNPEYQAELSYAYSGLAHLLEDEDPQRAEALHQKAIDVHTQAGVPTYRWGLAWKHRSFAQFLLRRNRLEESLQQIRQAIAIHEELVSGFPHLTGYRTELASAWLDLAEILKRAGFPHDEATEAARQACDEFIAAEPRSAVGYARRGEFYEQIHVYDKALTDYRKAADVEPNNAAHHIRLLYLYSNCPDVRLRDGRLALEHGRKAVALEPHNPNYYGSLAFAYRMQGNWQAMRDACAKALGLNPNHPQANWEMAQLSLAERDLDAALAFARKAIESAPHEAWSHSTCGDVHAKLGRYEEAVANYHKALELDRGSSFVHKRRAAACCRLKQWDNALADVARAIELNPHDATAVTWLLPHLGDPPTGFRDELVKLADRLIEELPDYGSAYWARAMLFAHFDESDSALADAAKAIELGPEDATLLNNAAWLVVRKPGVDAQAVERGLTWARRAVELTPQAAHARNTLGVAHYRTAAWQAALEALEKAEELSPGRALGFNAFFLAMAHWQLDQKDEARQWYDRAVRWMQQNGPDDEELLRFRDEAEELMGLKETPIPALEPDD